MYINIGMEDCINRLSKYLYSLETWFRFKHYTPEALIEAIKLVMCNNRMKFGDIFVCQVSGIAMGMSPAPTIANLYIAIYKQCHFLKYLETSLFFLKCFMMMALASGSTMQTHTDKQNWQESKPWLMAAAYIGPSLLAYNRLPSWTQQFQLRMANLSPNSLQSLLPYSYIPHPTHATRLVSSRG